MLCPICQVDLNITERQGIEIDYCPKCRGVWLDRGELDKLIERSAQRETMAASPAPRRESSDVYRDYDDDDKRKHGDRYYDDDHAHPQRKKKSFLGEIFDVLG